MTDAGSPNVTIVTAFFDIGRGQWQVFNRPIETYLTLFSNLAILSNPMIVYTSPELAHTVRDIRASRGHGDRTTVVTVENFTSGHEPMLLAMKQVMERPEFQAFVTRPAAPEYWQYHYVLVNLMKPLFLSHAFGQGIVATEMAAWVDFGYVRAAETLPAGLSWSVDLAPERIHAFTLQPVDPGRPIFDIVRTGDVYIMGGVLVGGAEAWKRLAGLSMDLMWTLLDCGLVDDDQTVLLMAARREPDLVEMHPIADWFDVLRDYGLPPAPDAEAPRAFDAPVPEEE